MCTPLEFFTRVAIRIYGYEATFLSYYYSFLESNADPPFSGSVIPAYCRSAALVSDFNSGVVPRGGSYCFFFWFVIVACSPILISALVALLNLLPPYCCARIIALLLLLLDLGSLLSWKVSAWLLCRAPSSFRLFWSMSRRLCLLDMTGFTSPDSYSLSIYASLSIASLSCLCLFSLSFLWRPSA